MTYSRYIQLFKNCFKSSKCTINFYASDSRHPEYTKNNISSIIPKEFDFTLNILNILLA